MKKMALVLLMALSVAGVGAGEWTADLEAAQKKAKQEKKMVVLNFTGSDWCGWCTKLKNEVFSQAEFKEYADKHLVLVEVDFPRKKALPKAQAEANQKLMAKHGVRGFPTIVTLNASGEEVWKQRGYLGGGAPVWVGKWKELGGAGGK